MNYHHEACSIGITTERLRASRCDLNTTINHNQQHKRKQQQLVRRPRPSRTASKPPATQSNIQYHNHAQSDQSPQLTQSDTTRRSSAHPIQNKSKSICFRQIVFCFCCLLFVVCTTHTRTHMHAYINRCRACSYHYHRHVVQPFVVIGAPS